jgi:hypothetical protein
MPLLSRHDEVEIRVTSARAADFHPAELREVPVPEPGPGEILV